MDESTGASQASDTALQDAVERVLAEHDLVLEELSTRRRGGTTEVTAVVDLPEDRLGSADLDTVGAAASALNELIDADESLLGSGPSLVELTTPGAERTLTLPRHFRRARGRLVELTTVEGAEHRARVLAVREASEIAEGATEREQPADEASPVLVLRPEAGRDDRGRPARLPAGTPDRLEVALDEVERARMLIEFTPPEDLDELLAQADGPESDAVPTTSKES